MNRYWIRIGVGALVVFVVGMTALAVVRKGTAEVRSFLGTTVRRLPLRFANIGFRLGGRHIGELTGLDIMRKGGSEGRITGRVELTELDAADQLRNCSLGIDDADHLNDRSTFYCIPESKLGTGDLVEVGEVAFEPVSLTRPLYLPRRIVDNWSRSDIQRLEASLARDGHGGVRAEGIFDILDHQRGSQRGSFNLRADSQGTVFSVRDELNRPLIDFSASSGGLNLNVRDRHGRNLLRLLADSLGAALRINK